MTKKFKLLAPVLGVGLSASMIIPSLVSCGSKKNTNVNKDEGEHLKANESLFNIKNGVCYGFKDSVTQQQIDEYTKSGKLVLPKCKKIGASAFKNVKTPFADEILIDVSTTTIDSFAFYGCTAEEVKFNGGSIIQSALNYIGDSAFAHCANLKVFKATPNLRQIGPKAFFGCYSLNGVDFSAFMDDNGDFSKEKFDQLWIENLAFGGIFTESRFEAEGVIDPNSFYFNMPDFKELYDDEFSFSFDISEVFTVKLLRAFEGSTLSKYPSVLTGTTNFDYTSGPQDQFPLPAAIQSDYIDVDENGKAIGIKDEYKTLVKNTNYSAIKFPSNVKSIDDAFWDEIPESVELLDLYDCEEMTTITPYFLGATESHGQIYPKAYYVRSIRLPRSIETIESKAFYHAESLNWVNLNTLGYSGERLTIGDFAFAYSGVDDFDEKPSSYETISKFELDPTRIASIGKYAFESTGIQSVKVYPAVEDSEELLTIDFGDGVFAADNGNNGIKTLDFSAFNFVVEMESTAVYTVDFDDYSLSIIENMIGSYNAQRLVFNNQGLESPENNVIILPGLTPAEGTDIPSSLNSSWIFKNMTPGDGITGEDGNRYKLGYNLTNLIQYQITIQDLFGNNGFGNAAKFKEKWICPAPEEALHTVAVDLQTDGFTDDPYQCDEKASIYEDFRIRVNLEENYRLNEYNNPIDYGSPQTLIQYKDADGSLREIWYDVQDSELSENTQIITIPTELLVNIPVGSKIYVHLAAVNAIVNIDYSRSEDEHVTIPEGQPEVAKYGKAFTFKVEKEPNYYIDTTKTEILASQEDGSMEVRLRYGEAWTILEDAVIGQQTQHIFIAPSVMAKAKKITIKMASKTKTISANVTAGEGIELTTTPEPFVGQDYVFIFSMQSGYVFDKDNTLVYVGSELVDSRCWSVTQAGSKYTFTLNGQYVTDNIKIVLAAHKKGTVPFSTIFKSKEIDSIDVDGGDQKPIYEGEDATFNIFMNREGYGIDKAKTWITVNGTKYLASDETIWKNMQEKTDEYGRTYWQVTIDGSVITDAIFFTVSAVQE